MRFRRLVHACRLWAGVLALAVVITTADAGEAGSPAEAEALKPPTAERLNSLVQSGEQRGWDEPGALLRATALRAYRANKLPAAAAWFNAYRWAKLFSEDEAAFIPRWIQTVQMAGVAHANMPTRYALHSRPLATALSPEVRAWLFTHDDFASEFFATLTSLDYVPAIFRILDELYRADPKRFARYHSLALAIAVVYDVPPPPDWPHAQVTVESLPRRWPAPRDAFAWWAHEDEAGHTYQPLSRLSADELKFVVDAAASFDDLAWTQKVANYPLKRLERAYTMTRYRTDRANNTGAVWSDRDYSLPQILGQGGICVDQAYFACETGKARGVPTLLFAGAGNDGLHAWFGFLDGDGNWRLDAGRYAEQRFVTGLARDPQTWLTISDHELKFLAERFRTRANFRRSQLETAFASDFLAAGETADAVRAARTAANYEPRNPEAWETLLSAQRAAGVDARHLEATLREAAQALQRYPDLEVAYTRRLCDSLRARGEGSAADVEERRLARKYLGDRSDLSVRQARDILVRSVTTQPLAQQIETYNSLVDNFGRGAGFAFYEQIVKVFVEHLLQSGRRTEALHAAERARNILKPESESQLGQALAETIQRLSH